MSDGPEIEQKVIGQLDSLGVPYEVVRIDPDFADTAEFSEKYGYPLENSGNTIIVASKKEPKQYCACVVRADTRLDVNHAVKRLMGVSRLSFAKPEETSALTGMMIGGVTALGLPDDLPVYVDELLMELDYVILGGGSRSCKIKVSPDLFRKLPNTRVVQELTLGSDD